MNCRFASELLFESVHKSRFTVYVTRQRSELFLRYKEGNSLSESRAIHYRNRIWNTVSESIKGNITCTIIYILHADTCKRRIYTRYDLLSLFITAKHIVLVNGQLSMVFPFLEHYSVRILYALTFLLNHCFHFNYAGSFLCPLFQWQCDRREFKYEARTHSVLVIACCGCGQLHNLFAIAKSALQFSIDADSFSICYILVVSFFEFFYGDCFLCAHRMIRSYQFFGRQLKNMNI